MSKVATDVVVVGGGIIGCAAAWRLARRGLDVTVVERGTPGRQATWAAGGMLSPLAEAEETGPFLELALASFRRYENFTAGVEEASGVTVEHRARGKLEVALDQDDEERLRRQYDWQRREGFEVELLDADEARRIEPGLSTAVRAGLLLIPDHQVDNRRLGRALWLAAERAGATFRLGSGVTEVLRTTDGARVRGVRLATGEVLAAERVIIAAGAWSGQLQGLPRPLPVVPVRGQMAALRTVPPAVGRVVVGAGCYLIPRAEGRLVVGATTEHAGFDTGPTAGGVESLLSGAIRTAPGLADAPVEELWAGLRPGTPDALPILGPDPAVHGLIYATGHYRNGILLAPITAAAVEALVTGEDPPVGLTPFAPDRDYTQTTVYAP